MKDARNAPAMPSTVVRINPLGLFGPGESRRAIIPAMKPTTMTQMMPPMAVVPFEGSMRVETRRNARRGIAASEPALQFILVRQPSVRRQMIDHVGQILAEAFQQIIARQSALRRQLLDLVDAERAGEVARRDLLVGTVADP